MFMHLVLLPQTKYNTKFTSCNVNASMQQFGTNSGYNIGNLGNLERMIFYTWTNYSVKTTKYRKRYKDT